MYCGAFLLGTLSGEVETPRRSFSIALVVLVPIVVLQIMLPLALSLSVNQNLGRYDRELMLTYYYPHITTLR